MSFQRKANHKVGIVSINSSCLKIYEFVPANQEEDGFSDHAYLQKPFTSRDLLVKVKNILAE